MLRRLSSATSFSSILRSTNGNETSSAAAVEPSTGSSEPHSPSLPRSRSMSLASSALSEALEYAIPGTNGIQEELDDSAQRELELAIDRKRRLAEANNKLVSALERLQDAKGAETHQRLELLAQIQLILTDKPETRNTFREHGGFLNCVSVIATVDSNVSGHEELANDLSLPFELVQLVFAVLALTFDGHDANRAAFNEGVGFDAVGEAIRLSGLLKKSRPTVPDSPNEHSSDRIAPASAHERLFSILYSFLVNDFSSSPMFTTLRHQLFALNESTPPDMPRPSRFEQIEVLLHQRADMFLEVGGETAMFAEVVPLLLDLTDQLETQDEGVDDEARELKLMVLCALRQLCLGSRRSVIGFQDAGVVKIGLNKLFPEDESTVPIRDEERSVWLDITSKVLEMGANPSETRTLCERAVNGWRDPTGSVPDINEDVLRMIIDSVRESRLPAFTSFDLSHAGYSGMTMRSLGKPFPPPTHGYTFMAWLAVHTSPMPDERLVVFGASDPSSRTFVEITVTPNMHLAFTSSVSKSPIVFDSFNLVPGRFHHIAVVHQRPRISLTSTLTLYIDGQVADITRAPYPTAPTKDNTEVRAWLGNPKDRVPEAKLSKGMSRIKWDLGPCWLIHGDIPEEMVYVCWTLGPRYTGNFQDQLGQFQTNSSSTDLNIRLDALSRPNRGTNATRTLPSNSPLVYAVRDKGSAVIPEHRIYFALSPINLVSASSKETGLLGSGLSYAARQALSFAIASKGQMIINAALPSKYLEDLLPAPEGVADLSEACVGVPKSLDEAIWTVGGVSVVLRLIEVARTESQLDLAVKLFVEVIGQSWRNSEDAERIQAYEILALLLKRKASLMSVRVYETLLELCGFDLQDGTQSVVSNVLAFRFIVLDFTLWSAVDVGLQQMHLLRLKQLLQLSAYPEFNLRRLTKMHVVRKVLFALRTSLFDDSLLEEVVDLLLELARSNFTTDTVRHIATFLTATLCQTIRAPPLMTPATPGQGEVDLGYTEPDDETIPSFIIDARDLKADAQSKASLRVLAGLHDLLLEPDAFAELQKFARIITTKWILLFLLDRRAPPLAAVYALRILVRLLQTQGNGYIAKFTNSMDGFAVLRGTLPHLWHCAQIDLALFALLHDHDISVLSLAAAFDPATFMQSCTETSQMAPDVVRVIVACLGRGLKVIERQEASTEPAGDRMNGHGVEGMSLLKGFETIVDIFSQSHRAANGNRALVMAPVALADLISALRPSLRLHSGAFWPSDSKAPSLPVMSAQTGFRLSPFSSAADPSDPLGLGVETAKIVIEPSSPVTSRRGSELTSSEPQDVSSVSEAAEVLLGFLSQRVMHDIVTRKTRKRSLTTSYETQLSPNADTSLNLLRDMFDASASHDVQAQVVFCTLLVNDICKRLTRAGTSPLVAQRVGEFFAMATDLAVEGWNADLVTMVEHVTAYIEKLLHDSLLGSHEKHGKPLDNLYQSLNRLILMLLANNDEHAIGLYVPMLIRHQLTIFADPNDYSEFVQCLCYRLYTLATSSANPGAIVNLFKLFILGRPEQIEFVLGEKKRKGFEAPFADRLVDNNVEGFIGVLKEYDHRLQQLKETWDAFVDGELGHARPALEKDLARMSELATAHRTRRDVHRKRVRRQRAAISGWSEGIHEVEATRVAHARQDMNDHSTFIEGEWTERLRSLVRERGVWAPRLETEHWQLDFTEGHNRMRKKLLRIDDLPSTSSTSANGVQQPQASDRQARSLGGSRNERLSSDDRKLEVEASPSPTFSPMLPQEEVIWKDKISSDTVIVEPDIADPAGDAAQVDPPAEEDKNRKVRRSLEQGDVIEAAFNVSRIVGMDAIAGLLLLAKKNVYIIDGFFQTTSGEIVNAWDAPDEASSGFRRSVERDRHLQTLADLAGRSAKPVSTTAQANHRSRRWAWSDLLEVHERKYLFRNVALELFFADGQSFLLTLHKDRRPNAMTVLAARCPAAVAFGSLSVAGSGLGGKFADIVRGQRSKLEQMTRRWEQRLVSNFEYLMFLNAISGRTYNDLTNYPVFPWIIADYDIEELDLNDPKTFRDLSKPMGAQSESRKREFEERFQQLAEMDDGTKPFHYGTHFSSAMIVVGYLVRLKPFTESYLDLQGGTFDHADRMFWSIPKAWESCSKTNRSDVRELIPEFFYLPDFLTNLDKLELGVRQEDGSAIDNVVLPKWAKGDPRMFVELHREALESDHVSAHLHEWIDLIFGCKSGTGPAAIASVNVYHHLSYEGAIDLDSIENADERKAATSTIHNFGMTPKQLFTKPHAARPNRLLAKGTRPIFSPDSTIEQQTVALVESIVPVCDVGQQVSTILASTPDKTTAASAKTVLVPGDLTHVVSWTSADQTVRVHPRGNPSSTAALFENMHAGVISCATFADSRTFITGSTDTTVSLWKFKWRGQGRGADGQFQQMECLRGHTDRVTCVTSSRSFSVVVSGSNSSASNTADEMIYLVKDHTAIIWDLNRRKFMHLLTGHETAVHLVAICDTMGDIATCSGAVLRLWTVNGVLLATHATSNFVDPITAIAFSKSETQPIVATGHRDGRIMLWRREWVGVNAEQQTDQVTPWRLRLLHVLTHKDRLGPRTSADVTALSFTSRTLYAGDSAGRVWLWNPPGTELVLPDSAHGGLCMGCSSKFGLMESRRKCSGCAGIFCSLCTTTNVEVGGISTFGSDPDGVREYLRPLLDFAKDVIPSDQHASTPIYLLATAGMRLLPPDQQQAVLSATCQFIRTSYSFSLPDCDSNIRIISGEEEGLYGWIAVNYLMDGFDRHEQISGEKGSSTYGFLDMGGASTQIAFEPSAKEQVAHADNLTEVKLRLLSGRDVTHPVFVTTWLGFGTNQARDRYIDKRVADFVSSADPTLLPLDSDKLGSERPVTVIADPCLPRDLMLSSGDKHPGYMLKGSGDFKECVRQTGPLLNKQVECLDDPCLFNGVHVPPIDFQVNHFIGISEYWYSTQDVWSSNGGVYDFVEFEKNAIDYCSRSWDEILDDHRLGTKWRPSVEVSRLETQCFKAAWIVNILHEGIGIPRIIDRGGQGDGKNVTDKAIQKGLDKGLVQAQPSFQSLNEVGDVAISWTLGKMVLEVSKGTTAIGDAPVHPDKLSDSRGRWRGHIPSWNGDFRSGIASIKNTDPVPVIALVLLGVLAYLFCLSSSAARRRQSVFGTVIFGGNNRSKRDFLPLSQDDGASSGSESGSSSIGGRGRRKSSSSYAAHLLASLRLGALRLTSAMRGFAGRRRRMSDTMLPTSRAGGGAMSLDPVRPRPLHPSKSAPFLRAMVSVPHSYPNNNVPHWNDAPNVSERERSAGAPSLLPRSHSATYLGQQPSTSMHSAPPTRAVSPPSLPHSSSVPSFSSSTTHQQPPPPMHVIPPSPSPTSSPSTGSGMARPNSRPTTPTSRSGLTKLTPRTRVSSAEDNLPAVISSSSSSNATNLPSSVASSPVKPFAHSSLYGLGGGAVPTTSSGQSTPTLTSAHTHSNFPLSTAIWESMQSSSSSSTDNLVPVTSTPPPGGVLDRVANGLRASTTSRNGSRTDLVSLARRSTGNLANVGADED
ncbi:beige protein-like 1 [Microbotryomycetes sp. JL201]|nr:beige protein-like 1 [Microbotryomycetes sp. JL201]